MQFDQLCSNCTADECLCFGYIDSTVSLLLNLKFQTSSLLLWLCNLIDVRPYQNEECWFSRVKAQLCKESTSFYCLLFKNFTTFGWAEKKLLSVIAYFVHEPCHQKQNLVFRPCPKVIKLFFMLSSAETKIYPAYKC